MTITLTYLKRRHAALDFSIKFWDARPTWSIKMVRRRWRGRSIYGNQTVFHVPLELFIIPSFQRNPQGKVFSRSHNILFPTLFRTSSTNRLNSMLKAKSNTDLVPISEAKDPPVSQSEGGDELVQRPTREETLSSTMLRSTAIFIVSMNAPRKISGGDRLTTNSLVSSPFSLFDCIHLLVSFGERHQSNALRGESVGNVDIDIWWCARNPLPSRWFLAPIHRESSRSINRQQSEQYDRTLTDS